MQGYYNYYDNVDNYIFNIGNFKNYSILEKHSCGYAYRIDNYIFER